MGVVSVAFDTRVMIPYVISFNFVYKSFLSCCFQRFPLPACTVTSLLLYFCFWEGQRKAAHAKITRKEGRSRNDLFETPKIDILERPCFLVIWACAAFRLPILSWHLHYLILCPLAMWPPCINIFAFGRTPKRNYTRKNDMSIESDWPKRVWIYHLHFRSLNFAKRSEASKVHFGPQKPAQNL